MYKPTIGLEIHAELRTASKMFCACANNTDEERPNANTCPVCMGNPGTLPVVNREAVKKVLMFGHAVNGTIADYTEFDRKNYFYPDIPKGYQISQYKFPLVQGGEIAGVKLTRVHLEEDTAKSSHESGDYSLVDFNRAGVPLMELVTEPVIHSAEQAGAFARELQLILQYLGASHANMEKGEMRVEANISISATDTFGTKVEVKNLNSFKAVEKAILYEIDRHTRLLESGQKIVQETRGWDETKQTTFSQRLKEDSHDYRYFPDPDIPKLVISEIKDFAAPVLKAAMPELPSAKRARYASEYGIKAGDIEVFVNNFDLATYFEGCIKALAGAAQDKKAVQLLSNYLVSDYLGLLKKAGKEATSAVLEAVSPAAFAELIAMLGEGSITSRAGKDILSYIFNGADAQYPDGSMPRAVAAKHNLIQKNDEGELATVMAGIIAAHPTVVAEYKAGKESAIQFFVGQGMKATKGSGNPALLKKIAEDLIKKAA